MDQFVSKLMSRMTLEEKIGQLNLLPGGDVTTGAVMNSPVAALIEKGQLGAVLNIKGLDKIRALQEVAVKRSRLGIPLLIGLDVIHGYETVLPVPLAQACSWDPAAIEAGARMAAVEASAAGFNWVYSPMVDIAHDPRWGRVVEGYGEDPYLSSMMGAAAVRGYQGDLTPEGGKKEPQVLACLKHYALYGATEAGKDYSTVDMSRLRMYNQYLSPYKAAVEAGVGSVMSSFNFVDGVPATANSWLLDNVLRRQWNFGGFVVTDYGSIGEMVTLGYGDLKASALQAMRAGTDMDMCSNAFSKYLKEAVDEGSISMAEIDNAVRRVLEAKYKLGLFADPYRYCNAQRAKKDIYTPAHRQLARDIAAETFVLLKNDGVLPLKKQGTIALIGPLADTRNNLPGAWSTGDDPSKYFTVKECMQRYLGAAANVVYAQGCNIYADSVRQHAVEFGRPIQRGDDKALINEAMEAAGKADVIVACLGEMAEMTGESSTRTDLNLPDVQMQLLKALVATGKPVVLLNFSGRPTILSWENDHVNALMNVWFAGSETGDALCDVLFGDKSPSGKLVNTFPRSMGQIPVYYNHISSSRPVADGEKVFHKYASNYIDETNGPLFPFGYGLSYTKFGYSDVSLSDAQMAKDGKITASVMVSNTGDRDGDEIVQMYIHDRYSTILRPVKELKGFKRVHIAKGGSVKVDFDIDAKTLQYLNAEGKPFLEPGAFEIMIGPNSRDVKTAELTVK
jgi:beta-glucosidase